MNKIKANTKFILKKTGLFVKKYSPEILLGTSIAANLGAVVLASNAGKNTVDDKYMHNEKISAIHSDMEQGAITEEEGKKALRKEYISYAGKIALKYLPTAACFSVGTLSTVGVHGILTSRNKDLSTLLATTSAAFASYRERVKEVLGEEGEKKLIEGLKEKEITNPETGEQEIVQEARPIEFNELTVFIEEGNSKLWDNNVGTMISHYMLLEDQVNIALKTDGALVGSDVCKMLGISKDMLTQEQIRLLHLYGWLYDPNDDTLLNHISLGISDRLGNISKKTLGDIREGKNYIAITLHFDGDVINGVNGNKMKTLDKYLSSPYSL